MDFVIGLSLSTNWKGESYNSILVIVDYLIKIVYCESIKVMINILGPVEVIINVVIYHHRVPESIVMN